MSSNRVEAATAAVVEAMEVRRLLSVAVVNGVLTINDSGRIQQRDITISIDSGTGEYAVTDDNAITGVGSTQEFPTAGIDSYDVLDGFGSTTIQIDASFPNQLGMSTIQGGNGADSIVASDGGHEVIFGSNAPGYIRVRGPHEIVQSGPEGDTIAAGPGLETILGNGGNDSILLGSGSEVANTGSGNSTIVGGTGDASIVGGSGTDLLIGGSGNDTIDAGSGRTIIRAGSGNQLLIGGSGSDKIRIDSPTASDTVQSGTGNNTINANSGPDSIDGSGGGNNVISADSGMDTVLGATGSSGMDTIFSADGDIITAGPRDSVIPPPI
jgi:Ca2+-binding RTX toxin-like protein